jgi:signal transduction histidine kinase/ActR/RegA family two-component response regulator
LTKEFRDPPDRLIDGTAILVSALALLVLGGGWLLGIERLRSLTPYWSAMAPLTAVLLLLQCASVVWFERRRTWANTAMILVVLISFAVFAEYFYDVPFPLGPQGAELPAPDTAAAFLLITTALLCYRTSNKRLHDFADVVVVVIGMVCLQVLLAYGYNVIGMSSWSGFRQIAPHSTLAVMLLAFVATARRPTMGLYRATRGSSQATYQLRILLPATVLFCAILGLLQSMALEQRIIDPNGLIAWTVIAAITGLALLLFVTTADMRKVEAKVEQRQQELIAAKTEAEAASEAKSRFMAVMSHELRTPLAAVIGYTNLIGEGLTGDLNEETRNYVDRIRASGWHLVGLIDAVLLYAGGEAPADELRLQRVEVGQLTSTVASIFEREATQKGVALRVTAPDGTWVVSDLRKLRQMLTNLLENAVKFTDRGSIDVRVIAESQTVLIEITDTGIGIDTAQIEHIWEPFHQVDASHTRTRGGMGLGLAVTRKIAEQIGAAVRATSNADGSTFTIELPRVEPQDAKTIELNGARVLVVDDASGVRRIMARTLTRYGGNVIQAASAHEALDRIAEESRFDVLVTDISMPGMTGIELAQRLRTGLFDAPILFVTGAELDADDQAEVARLGGAVLRKPFDMVELVRAVQQMAEG